MTTFGSPSLPMDLDRQLRAELEDGEQLLWADQPNPGRLAMGALPLCIIGLLLGGFAVVWIAGASGLWGSVSRPEEVSTLEVLFPFFGAPFVIVGLIMILSPLFAYRKGKTTVYGVTDRRAIVISQGLSRMVKSYRAQDIGSIQCIERADGTGSVLFAHPHGTNSRDAQASVSIGFVGIHQPREVERTIEKLVETHGKDGKSTDSLSPFSRS